MGRATPRLLLALIGLGLGLGPIPGRMGPSYFLPKVDFLRLGLDGAEPPGASNFLPPPEDVGRPTTGRFGREGALGVGLSLTMPGIGLTVPLLIILAFGLGRRRFGVIVFPRPGITRLMTGSVRSLMVSALWPRGFGPVVLWSAGHRDEVAALYVALDVLHLLYLARCATVGLGHGHLL